MTAWQRISFKETINAIHFLEYKKASVKAADMFDVMIFSELNYIYYIGLEND